MVTCKYEPTFRAASRRMLSIVIVVVMFTFLTTAKTFAATTVIPGKFTVWVDFGPRDPSVARQVLQRFAGLIRPPDGVRQADFTAAVVVLPSGKLGIRTSVRNVDESQSRAVLNRLLVSRSLYVRPISGDWPTQAAIPDNAKPTDADNVNRYVVLSDLDGREYLVGPAELTGSIVNSAVSKVNVAGDWEVDVNFTKSGLIRFNEFAAKYQKIDGQAGRVALVVNNRILFAGSLNASTYDRTMILSSFSKQRATDLANAIQLGAVAVSMGADTSNGVRQ